MISYFATVSVSVVVLGPEKEDNNYIKASRIDFGKVEQS